MNEKFYFLNSLNIGILILNSQKKVIFVNDWLRTKLSSDNDLENLEELSRSDKKICRFPDSVDSAIKYGQSSVLTPKLNKMPIKLFRGNTQLSYILSVSRLSKDTGKDVKVLLQFGDVTQVRERERYLMEKQKELDAQRDRSFYQERLSALGELTSSIAHEINNPLAILEMNYKTFEKMLKRANAMNEDFQEVFDEGIDTIRRVNDLISSVQSLARAPSSEDFTKECLSDVLRTAMIVFKEKSRSIGVDLSLDLEKEVFNTEVDVNRALIGQVFVNLLNNSFHAIKNLDEKWIEIDGEIKNDEVTLTFTDSGNGIPKEVQEKIFIPFFTTKDIGEGTGLGLSTSMKVMSAHKGELRIDNDCKNTRFVINFPVKQINRDEN